MTLLERRRMLMSRKAEEDWDFVIEADENGLIPKVVLRNSSIDNIGKTISIGQKITIAWNATGFDGNASRMLGFLGYTFNDNQSYSEAWAVNHYGIVGRVTITSNYNVPQAGQRLACMILSRNWMNSGENQFMGKYIKVKIHPME